MIRFMVLFASLFLPRAEAACVKQPTGIGITIPAVSDPGSVWAPCIVGALGVLNSSGAVSSTNAVTLTNTIYVSTISGLFSSGGIAVSSSIFMGVGTNITMNGALNMNSNLINSVTDPASAQDAATKNYVDNNILGLQFRGSCRLATTAALPTNAYSNGSSGVGATLTGLGLGLLTVDGVSPAVSDRLLVKNEAAQANNGIYTVTVNAGGAFYVLTRATDHNQASEMPAGIAVLIDTGNVNNESGWVQQASVTVVGTDPIVFNQFTGLGTISVGAGLTKVGNTIALSTPVAVANGGTAATTTVLALASLGAAALGANSDITSLRVMALISTPTTVTSSFTITDSRFSVGLTTFSISGGLITASTTVFKGSVTIYGYDSAGYSLKLASGLFINEGFLKFTDGTTQNSAAAVAGNTALLNSANAFTAANSFSGSTVTFNGNIIFSGGGVGTGYWSAISTGFVANVGTLTVVGLASSTTYKCRVETYLVSATAVSSPYIFFNQPPTSAFVGVGNYDVQDIGASPAGALTNNGQGNNYIALGRENGDLNNTGLTQTTEFEFSTILHSSVVVEGFGNYLGHSSASSDKLVIINTSFQARLAAPLTSLEFIFAGTGAAENPTNAKFDAKYTCWKKVD